MLSLNSLNCWKPLRAESATTHRAIGFVTAEKLSDWAISSQASKKLDEGSTTRSSNRSVKSAMTLPRMGSACKIQDVGDTEPNMTNRKFFLSKDELKREYKQLKSTTKIAKKYGVCKKTILVWMRNYGLKANAKNRFVILRKKVSKLVRAGKTSREISKLLGVDQNEIARKARICGLKIRNDFHKGYAITHNGYKVIRKNGQYVREHRLIAEEKLARKLKKNEIVHHIDENKLNNNPDNLIVMTLAEHTSLHHKCK